MSDVIRLVQRADWMRLSLAAEVSDGSRVLLAPMPTPEVRKPGSAWIELPRPRSASAEPVGHVRIGYARASTARQSLDTQIDNRVAPEVCQSVSGRVRGSPKRVMTLVLKLVMAVMWSPAVVMTRRQ